MATPGASTGRVDSVGMWDLTLGLPEQVEAATDLAAAAERLPSHEDIENVVVLGMGGSGIAGDVVREVAGPFMAVPVVVHKGYSIPNFIGERTLVLVVSCSGNTEETLDAATNAMMQGGHVVGFSAGGELADLVRGWDMPHVPLPPIPMPRAAIGAVSIPALVVLDRCGLYPGSAAWIDAAVVQLRRRRDELAAGGGIAAAIAERVGGRIPIVYGGGGLSAAAAYRWKCQVNENAKAPAFWNASPELCHNEICGWGPGTPVDRSGFAVVNLRSEFEHPQLARRFDYVDALLAEVVHDVCEVRASGDGSLAQLLDLILVGDVVSLHLAAAAGVDPGPIPVLDDLKAVLAQEG